ncbi:Rv3235 family protein [Nocardiopsis mangrovi]|uniref:Rv3235 family protein n=1 Tax=Nocardiopsis mangrovi TaxID=1179818 RepID=A0ABV9E0B4_9ACTN
MVQTPSTSSSSAPPHPHRRLAPPGPGRPIPGSRAASPSGAGARAVSSHGGLRRSVPASPQRACPRDPRARQLSHFAQFIAEVLAGERAPAQMRHLFSRQAYALLLHRAGGYASGHRPRVLRTLLRAEHPGVTEVSAVVDCGTRCRALALRIAYAQHAWLCTHVETDIGRGR